MLSALFMKEKLTPLRTGLVDYKKFQLKAPCSCRPRGDTIGR